MVTDIKDSHIQSAAMETDRQAVTIETKGGKHGNMGVDRSVTIETEEQTVTMDRDSPSPQKQTGKDRGGRQAVTMDTNVSQAQTDRIDG